MFISIIISIHKDTCILFKEGEWLGYLQTACVVDTHYSEGEISKRHFLTYIVWSSNYFSDNWWTINRPHQSKITKLNTTIWETPHKQQILWLKHKS